MKVLKEGKPKWTTKLDKQITVQYNSYYEGKKIYKGSNRTSS